MQSFLNKYLTVCYTYGDTKHNSNINITWSRDKQEFTLGESLQIKYTHLHFVNHKYAIASNTESLTLENSSLIDLDSVTVSTNVFHKNNEILYSFENSDQYIYIDLNKNILLEMEYDILDSSLIINTNMTIEEVSNDLEKIFDIATTIVLVDMIQLELCGSVSSNEFEQYQEPNEYAKNAKLQENEQNKLNISIDNILGGRTLNNIVKSTITDPDFNLIINSPEFKNSLTSAFNIPEIHDFFERILNSNEITTYTIDNNPDDLNKLD